MIVFKLNGTDKNSWRDRETDICERTMMCLDQY